MNGTKKMNGPQGINGWLLIPLLGLLTSLGSRLLDQVWRVLGADLPLPQGYVDTSNTTITVLSFAVAALHVMLMVWILRLCHGRSQRFPKWMRISLWLQIAIDAFSVLVIWLAGQGVDSNARTGSMASLVWSIAWAAIWIPYFYRSRRVKATFINR